ncbi:sensor histidine kinase [Shinella zoogloeoides]|uniref:sensor histidine kinase n=1 Tax=Shinella zoogloeoides TaxID=352475 RepID=UPI001F55E62A|nr:ATP-binding protein [Shinella zoogloeoides]
MRLWSDMQSWQKRLGETLRVSVYARFLLISGTIVLGMMTILALFVSSHVKAVSISSTAQTDAFYMTAFVAPLVQDISDDTLLPAETIAQLDRLMHIATVDNDVEMARIWRRDGTILYSTDKATIGTRADLSGAEIAFRGEVIGHVEQVSDDVGRHFGARGMPLFEVYAPLHSLETGAIIAVGEFYKNAQPLIDQISSANTTIWSTTASVSVMMMGMLFLLARRSNRIIVEQRDRLKRRAAKASALARQNEKLRGQSDLAKLQAIKANEDLLTDIGSTLHDGPIQSLALLVLKLSTVGTDARRIVEDCAESARLAGGVVHDLRDMATGLVLPELEDLAVEQVVRLAVDRHETLTGTSVALDIGPLPAQLPPAYKICIFRVIQESLHNAFQHAGGADRQVSAAWSDEGISIVIRNGPARSEPREQAPPRQVPGLGVTGLRRRLRALGGSLSVATVPGSGTVVTAALPVDPRMMESVPTHLGRNAEVRVQPLGRQDNLDPVPGA